jgi:hypothetical protein
MSDWVGLSDINAIYDCNSHYERQIMAYIVKSITNIITIL